MTSAAAPVPSAARAQAARVTMRQLTADLDVFQTFFESVRIGLALADLSGRFVRVNSTYAELVGSAPEDLVGGPLSAVLGAPVDAGQAEVEGQYLRADGSVRWLLHSVAVVSDAEGRPAWLAVSAQDVTERRRAEQELRELTAVLAEQAVRDPLTGLANRTLLEERLRGSLARDARTGGSTGLLFLDLDGFKEVNDRHGHAVGDAVLRAVAGRLAGAVRPSDTLARLGGDEFVVLVESATDEALGALARRLGAAIKAPVQVGDLELLVGVSVGSAVSREGEHDPGSLLAAADARMYDAKRARR
jgi:diguanylate cyclase (GGDEF)-like protein